MAAVAPESCELVCWLLCLGCGFLSSHQKQGLLKVVRKEQPEKSVSYWKLIIEFLMSSGPESYDIQSGRPLSVSHIWRTGI